MDNKAYLEQIASETRSSKPQGKGILGTFQNLNISPLGKKLLLGGAILAVLIIIIVAIAGGSGSNKTSERDLIDTLSVRTNNLIETIENYNDYVKSSDLRAMGNSLKSVITEVGYATNTSLVNDFGATTGTPENENVVTSEDEWLATLTTTLEKARLNGLLDRVYSREFAYQIGMLISLESETYTTTDKEPLKTSLDSSMKNLDQLYTQFDNFSAK